MKALILAGGRGERLMPLTNDLPKVMIDILGKPLLEHQMNLLKNHKIKNVVICVHYLAEKIIDYFGDGSSFGMNVEYSVENEPLGTGGAIKNAENFLDGDFVVLSGDVLTNINITKLVEFHKQHKGIATCVVRETEHPQDSDLVKIDSSNKIVKIMRKGEKNKTGNLANTGIFVFRKKMLEYIPKKCNLENDVLYNLLEKENIFAYIPDDFVMDIGTLERLRDAREKFKKYIL